MEGKWAVGGKGLLPSPPPQYRHPSRRGARCKSQGKSQPLSLLCVCFSFFGLFLGCCRLLVAVPPDLSSLIKEPLSGASSGIKITV